MNSNIKSGRIVGILLLFIFIIGVLIYQVLRGPIVFSDEFLSKTALNSNQIIISILLGFTSGILSIIIATILLPIFKRYSTVLAYTYFAFCFVNFVAISLENFEVIPILELSNEFVKSGATKNDFYQIIGTVFYENHKWAHYLYLLISCVPVFVLYYTLFYSKLIPRILSIFGMIAVVLMLIDVLLSIFRTDIGVDLIIPMGLIQLILPLWLIIKGFKEKTKN